MWATTGSSSSLWAQRSEQGVRRDKGGRWRREGVYISRRSKDGGRVAFVPCCFSSAALSEPGGCEQRALAAARCAGLRFVRNERGDVGLPRLWAGKSESQTSPQCQAPCCSTILPVSRKSRQLQGRQTCERKQQRGSDSDFTGHLSRRGVATSAATRTPFDVFQTAALAILRATSRRHGATSQHSNRPLVRTTRRRRTAARLSEFQGDPVWRQNKAFIKARDPVRETEPKPKGAAAIEAKATAARAEGPRLPGAEGEEAPREGNQGRPLSPARRPRALRECSCQLPSSRCAPSTRVPARRESKQDLPARSPGLPCLAPQVDSPDSALCALVRLVARLQDHLSPPASSQRSPTRQHRVPLPPERAERQCGRPSRRRFRRMSPCGRTKNPSRWARCGPFLPLLMR